MGKATAAPVDFQGAAVAEGEAAQKLTEQQTWANRPNQVNPWGTMDWSATPYYDPTTGQDINQWTQTQSLDPALNDALKYQMNLMAGRSQLGAGMMGNVSDEMSKGMNWDQFGMPQNIPDQRQMTNVDLPGLWGQLQNDIPTYQTSSMLDQLNFSGAPGVMAPQFGVQRAEDAIYGRSTGRLDPKFAGEQQALEIKLRNQGLTPGDQAYNSEMQNFNMGKNDAYQNAMMESIMGGGQEAQRMLGMEQGYRNQYTGEVERAGQFANQAGNDMFGQRMQAGQQGFADTLSAAQFQNQARGQAFDERLGMNQYNQNLDFRMSDYYNNLRQQMINEEMTRRGQSLNETNALISGQQVGLPQFNSFSQAGVAQAPQLLAASQMTGQQNAANASAQNAGMEGLMSGIGGLAGVAGQYGMFSDRRLKTNIRKLGVRNGQQWYSYDYIWGQPSIGVMADEVPEDARILHPSGFWMVDYSKV